MVNLIFLYNKHLHIFPFGKETYVYDIYVLCICIHIYTQFNEASSEQLECSIMNGKIENIPFFKCTIQWY